MITDSASMSMTTIPFNALDTDGRKTAGVLHIRVNKFNLETADLSENVKQAVDNCATLMNLKPGDNLSAEKVAQLSIHAAQQLYTAATSSLASFYELAKETFVNNWYLGTPGISLGEKDIQRMMNLKDSSFPEYLRQCWALWVDAVCVDIKTHGFTGNMYALKSDLKHKLPGLLSLPMGAVEIKVLKTGERSATIEANGVKIEVDDLFGEKIPVKYDIVKAARDLEIGEEITITKEVSPDYLIDNASLIRELGSAAEKATTETAPKFAAMAAMCSTYGFRQEFSERGEGKPDKAPMEKSVTTDGEVILVLHPKNDWQETWAVAQLDPQFQMVLDNE